MKAAVMGNVREVTFQDVPTLNLDGRNVLIEVKKAGICGSDKHTWELGTGAGQIVGHEYSGVVLDPGGRGDLKKGDKVTSVTMNPCLKCDYCLEGNSCLCKENAKFVGGGLQGVFAERLLARPELVCKLDDRLDFTDGALAEPVAVSYHAVKKAGIKKGDTVLISGVGCLTSFTAQIARYFGAKFIVCTGSSLKRAKALLKNGDVDGFVCTAEPGLYTKLKQMVGKGFDAYIDVKGDINGISSHLPVLKKGRTCVVAGVNYIDKAALNVLDLTLDEKILAGSFAYNVDEFREVLQLMADGKIEPRKYAGKSFPLEKISDAFEYSAARTTTDLKVFVEM